MAAARAGLPILRYCRAVSSTVLARLRSGGAARRALEESERRFRAIVEDQTEMICRFDSDFRLTFSNRAHARFLGGEPDEVLGRDFLASFPSGFRESLREALLAVTADAPVHRCEHERASATGEVEWFAWTNRALFDPRGRRLGYQSVGRDVTARKRADQALRESETRFRTIVDDQMEFISRCSPDYRFTFVNRAYARQLGRRRDEILGTSVLELMTPDQQGQFVAQLARLTPACPTVSYQMRSVAPDGRPVWEEWTDRALFDEGGRLVEYQSVGRDVTEVKTFEATLKASAAELALIADCMPLAVTISRMDRMEILFSNAEAQEGLGLHPGCSADRIAAAFEDPADHDRILGRVARDGGVEGYELSLRRKDGALVRALLSAREIRFRGAPALVAAVTDITARLEIEQALRTSEARLAAFMQHAPAGMYLKDLEGRYVVANPEMERVQDRPVAQIVGHTPEDVFTPELAAEIRGYDRQVLSTSAAVVNEEHVPYLPHYTHRMVIRFPVRDEHGRFTHIGGFIFDTSERKRAEAEADRQRAAMHQREKLAALGSLLAGVSHELNNPLSVVLGRAIMLEEECADPQVRDSLGRLRAAAERCARIVRSFLAIARQKTREVRPVDVRAVLDGSLEILASGLRSAGVEVEREDGPGPSMVMADEDELHQVFMNLILNAQQALEAVEGARRLWLTVSDEADGPVRVQVADNGPGVPDALRDQIFEPFFTTKPAGAGTGLGLSVCHGIVTAHGGSIAVADRPGGGALFAVTLPACPAGVEPAPAPTPETGAGGEAVLLIDDEPEVVTMLEEVLARDGYEVVTAGDGATGLELARTGRFDAILCDVRMPQLDGAALLRALEAVRPELVSRLLLMTGDVLRAATALPPDAQDRLLEKPIDPAVVRRRVRQLIDGRPRVGPP